MNERIRFWSPYYLFGAGLTLVASAMIGPFLGSLMGTSHPIGFRAILVVPVILIYFFGNRGLVFVRLNPSEIRFRPLFRPWPNRLSFNEIAELRLHQHSEVEMEFTVLERKKPTKVMGTLLRGLEYVLVSGILRPNLSDGGQFIRVEAVLHSGEKTRVALLPAPDQTNNRAAYTKLVSYLKLERGIKTMLDRHIPG